MAEPRNPRAEADRLVGPGMTGRLLEPSPPAVTDDHMADDPVARGEVASGLQVVSPVPGEGDLTWTDWVAGQPAHAGWASRRWLADPPRIPAEVPAGYDRTRRSLHLLATNVLTPARYRRTGKIALRWTLGGFGTPFFGDDEQVRVEGTDLVLQRAGRVWAEPITTLGAAARLVLGQDTGDLGWVDDLGINDRPPLGEPDQPLEVDAAAAAFLGDFYGLAFAVLERLRADGHEASRPQLWPEHFDPAIEVLPDRRRGSYGFFPGDDRGGPYAYAMMWYPDDVPASADPIWDAEGYAGSELSLAEIGAIEGDQVAHVADWLRVRRDRIARDT